MTRGHQGITLIELVVVISILAVMLTFVGPPMSAGIDNLMLDVAGRRVISAFRLAQTFARTQGEQVIASYDETTLTFLKSGQIHRTLAMPRGVRLIPIKEATTVVFLRSGQIIGPDTVDLINSRGRRIRLSIDHATGLVKRL